MRTFYVYEHWRPDKGACFYVGKGCRYRANSVERPHNRHHSAIVRKLKGLGLEVEVRIVARDLSEATAFALEIERIAFWRSQGATLANLTGGGDGLSNPAPEVRAKISAKATERMAKAEERARISQTKTGTKRAPFSDAWKANMSAAAKERKRIPLSPETRARISAARLVNWADPTYRDKHVAIRRRRPKKWHTPVVTELLL